MIPDSLLFRFLAGHLQWWSAWSWSPHLRENFYHFSGTFFRWTVPCRCEFIRTRSWRFQKTGVPKPELGNQRWVAWTKRVTRLSFYWERGYSLTKGRVCSQKTGVGAASAAQGVDRAPEGAPTEPAFGSTWKE